MSARTEAVRPAFVDDVCICGCPLHDHATSTRVGPQAQNLQRCKRNCAACCETGFKLDVKASPPLRGGEIVCLRSSIDRHQLSYLEQTEAEIVIEKMAFQLFGKSVDKLADELRAEGRKAIVKLLGRHKKKGT